MPGRQGTRAFSSRKPKKLSGDASSGRTRTPLAEWWMARNGSLPPVLPPYPDIVLRFMAAQEPRPVEKREAGRRRRYIARIARSLGFRGRVEYRHVYSQTGGAQFCVGPRVDADLLVVYAEAFERDRDPQDFSLQAIVAHECGHQRLARDRELAAIRQRLAGSVYEEVLASLLGSILVGDPIDAGHLVWKATNDLAGVGLSAEQVTRTIEQLRRLLKELL
jgi:hypothetical protein